MKRKVGILVSMAVLGAVGCLGNRANAQQQQPTYPAPGTNTAAMAATAQPKVAMINMYVIMKSYKKFDIFRQQVIELTKKFQEENKKSQQNYEGWQKKLQEATTDQQRDEAQKNIVAWKRILEDATAAANKALSAKEDEMIVQMYREIQDAAKSFALSNGIQLIMTYTEPVSEADMYSAGNVKRKMQASGQGACTPIYMAQGLDVSQSLVNMLNERYNPTPGITPVSNGPANTAPAPGR